MRTRPHHREECARSGRCTLRSDVQRLSLFSFWRLFFLRRSFKDVSSR